MSRGTTAANLAGLRLGELDAALVRARPSALSGFKSDLLRVDELVAVVTSDDPLASCSGVRPADVATRESADSAKRIPALRGGMATHSQSPRTRAT
jgi:DNA-binding transcriptional LysR family regulator